MTIVWTSHITAVMNQLHKFQLATILYIYINLYGVGDTKRSKRRIMFV